VSLSCGKPGNAQLDEKFLDFGVQVGEKAAKKDCSEKNLSEVDCNKVREDKVKRGREMMQEAVTKIDESSKKLALSEDQRVERKQKLLKQMIAESENW
jgi:hypothetical protein